MMYEIITALQTQNFFDLKKVWAEIGDSLTITYKQELLVDLIDNHYQEKEFGTFIKVFDIIIDDGLPLNFNIDHWAPTFLSLVSLKASKPLFNYFLRKGANINFIGDSYAFETDEIIKQETRELSFEIFCTCLDFAENILADKLSTDYNYHVPDIDVNSLWSNVDDKEEVTIKKREYHYLIEQSQYLHDLIHIDRLVEHIKSLGGKTYQQLSAH